MSSCCVGNNTRTAVEEKGLMGGGGQWSSWGRAEPRRWRAIKSHTIGVSVHTGREGERHPAGMAVLTPE